MASSSGTINSAGIGVIAAGVVIAWAGLRNQSIIAALRDLATGQAPQPNPKPPFTPLTVEFEAGPRRRERDDGSVPPGGGGPILEIAASLKGQRYCFGGGHGKACAGACSDCSGYVSCVLNRAGMMRGTMTTDGLAKFGVGVPFSQRRPGDILVWIGGAGGGHCGIAIDGSTMWHNACTGCGGVQKGRYGPTRTGRTTVVRRPRSVAI